MLVFSCPRPSGLGEIDGLHGTSTQSCILTYDLCTGEPLRRPKPAQDKWYVIMSGHPFIKALAAYWGGAFVQGLRCHLISMPGKSPMKLEVTSRHDHSCLLGRKASKQTNKIMTRLISSIKQTILTFSAISMLPVCFYKRQDACYSCASLKHKFEYNRLMSWQDERSKSPLFPRVVAVFTKDWCINIACLPCIHLHWSKNVRYYSHYILPETKQGPQVIKLFYAQFR